MTREEVKKKAEIMLAYAEGKQIQWLNSNGEWADISSPCFIYNSSCYRIKQEPKYRPFESADEVMEAIKKKGNILKSTSCPNYVIIREWSDGHMWTTASAAIKFEEAFDRFTFADGTPFGKLEE